VAQISPILEGGGGHKSEKGYSTKTKSSVHISKNPRSAPPALDPSQPENGVWGDRKHWKANGRRGRGEGGASLSDDPRQRP